MPLTDACRSGAYQFGTKQTWMGFVIMYREALPDCTPGTWYWSPWRRATWADMHGFKPEYLK